MQKDGKVPSATTSTKVWAKTELPRALQEKRDSEIQPATSGAEEGCKKVGNLRKGDYMNMTSESNNI
jgi:hypothetical protein